MALLASIATGNFTAAGTWGTVNATSYLGAETGSEILTTAGSGTRSSAFTPGAITISHIGVKLSVRTGTTGTMSVRLVQAAVEVAGTLVTINTADLPVAATADANGAWVFFKLAATVTLVAATAYNVEALTSSASMVSLFRDATADNISRALITTTTAAPAVTDDLIVAGEYTGAGTSNSFTVTLDNTATTDFGAAPTAANSLLTPGLAICSKGTVTYGSASATNYYYKVSNSVIVYSGGTLNIGTVATPIPRDGSAVLEFDPAADGDYGLLVRNLGTCIIQGLSRTSGKNVVSCKLNVDEAANSTLLDVNTDTGWLDNDQIAVASTTRTPAQSELGAINITVSATQLTVDGFAGAGGGLLNAHSGTSPTQAEVILLTRNVRVRSATSTIMTYVFCASTSTVDIDWADFRYIGDNATNKRGIEIATTTAGSFNMQYCSIRDTEDGGLYFVTSSGSIVISNNCFYNLNTAISLSEGVLISATTGAHTISDNVFITIASPSGSNNISILDLGSTFTNNTMVSGSGTSSHAIFFRESDVVSTGTISGNVVHSCANAGVGIHSNALSMQTIGSMTIYRTAPAGSAGLNLAGFTAGTNIFNYILDSWTLFGNQTSNIGDVFTQAILLQYNIIFLNCSIQGDSAFSTTQGLSNNRGNNTAVGRIVFINCNFGTTTTHTTADIQMSGLGYEVILINTTLASGTEVASTTLGALGVFIRSHKHDASATTFRNWYKYGIISSNQTTRYTASGYSWQLAPNRVDAKLLLPGPTTLDTFKAAVNASTLVTIKAWVQKDGSYNGNAPRLVLVGGMIGGIASDVTASLTVGASTWEELTVTGTPNELGVVEYYLDCDGTAGNIFVDDITVTQA